MQCLSTGRLIIMLILSVMFCASSRAAPPNLLVILVDDLGFGDLSSFGATDLRSPHIDRLISQGMRFDNFYANCPVCSPTRASLLTGCYPEVVGVPGVIRTHANDSWGYLDPNAKTLAHVLRQGGYQTTCVGKWHLGLDEQSHPLSRGFDSFHGFLGDMMDDYFHHRRHDINYMRRDHDKIDPEGHATDLFSQWSCEFLRGRANIDQPFFLYLAYNAPHTPIQPPEDWLRKVKQREPQLDAKRAALVALIEHMDAGIGRVLSCLDQTGLGKNTLIVFTSDNGGHLGAGANNGSWRDGKQSMYEGGLRVPACVVWPDQIEANSKTDHIALTMDLFPTLCAAAGIELEGAIDGISLLPTLRGHSQETADRDLFFHRREGGIRYGGLTIQAVRRGDWKLLQNSPFAPQELYNLKDDPHEQHDLAKQERAVFVKLAAALRRQNQRGGSVPWQPPHRRDMP